MQIRQVLFLLIFLMPLRHFVLSTLEQLPSVAVINSSLLGELQKGPLPAAGLAPGLTGCHRIPEHSRHTKLMAFPHALCSQMCPVCQDEIVCAQNSCPHLFTWLSPPPQHSPQVRCSTPLPLGPLLCLPCLTSLCYCSPSHTISFPVY